MLKTAAQKFPANMAAVISGATREELAVALYVLSKDTYTVSAAAKELNVTEEQFKSALSFWRGAGVLLNKEQKAVSPDLRDQRYDGETVAKSLESDKGFRDTCDALQSLYGKMFTRFDFDSLLYLYDHCGLTAEYLCTLATFCVNNGKIALRYFTKTAQGLVSEGIDTYEKLERHLEKRIRATDRIYRLRRLCGFGERAFTAKEEEYANDWFAEKDLAFDLVEYAYEIMINAIGEVKLSYMNKILCRWYKDGIRTVEEAKNQGQKTEKQKPSATSFDEDEFFAAAVAHTKKKMEGRK